jgi:hypothetical protein
VWLETRSVIGQTSEWEVFGFTDGGAPSHLLSSGNESNREQFYAPEHRPVSVDDERAYVTALFPPQGDEAMHYPKILSVPLSGGSPQVHVENGYHPMATDDGLYFLRSGVVGTKRVPTELWFWARGSAEPRLVQELTTSKDEQVFSVCVTADVRAWVITGFGATTERVMIQRGDEEPKSITLNGGGSESRISCGDGIVGWDGGVRRRRRICLLRGRRRPVEGGGDASRRPCADARGPDGGVEAARRDGRGRRAGLPGLPSRPVAVIGLPGDL